MSLEKSLKENKKDQKRMNEKIIKNLEHKNSKLLSLAADEKDVISVVSRFNGRKEDDIRSIYLGQVLHSFIKQGNQMTEDNVINLTIPYVGKLQVRAERDSDGSVKINSSLVDVYAGLSTLVSDSVNETTNMQLVYKEMFINAISRSLDV
jgi:hypothetical protein